MPTGAFSEDFQTIGYRYQKHSSLIFYVFAAKDDDSLERWEARNSQGVIKIADSRNSAINAAYVQARRLYGISTADIVKWRLNHYASGENVSVNDKSGQGVVDKFAIHGILRKEQYRI